MPVYNGEPYIGAALSSLLAQSFGDFELIVSDNASTDGTAEVCRAFATRDVRVKYSRSAENKGSAWNFNRVFELSTAPYFMWAAHDDLWDRCYVQRCVELLEAVPDAVLCSTRAAAIGSDGQWLKDLRMGPDLASDSPAERFRRFLVGSTAFHSFFGLMRTEAVRKTSLLRSCDGADELLLANLTLLGKSCEVPECLFYNRETSSRASRAYDAADLAVWYSPANRGKSPSAHLSRLLGLVDSVRRTPMPARDRLRCYWMVLRWLNWNRNRIAREAAHRLTPFTGRGIASARTHSFAAGLSFRRHFEKSRPNH